MIDYKTAIVDQFRDGWTIFYIHTFGDKSAGQKERKMSFVLPFRSLRAARLGHAFVQEFQAEMVEVQPPKSPARVVVPKFATMEIALAALEYAEAMDLAFHMGETK